MVCPCGACAVPFACGTCTRPGGCGFGDILGSAVKSAFGGLDRDKFVTGWCAIIFLILLFEIVDQPDAVWPWLSLNHAIRCLRSLLRLCLTKGWSIGRQCAMRIGRGGLAKPRDKDAVARGCTCGDGKHDALCFKFVPPSAAAEIAREARRSQ